MVLAVPSTEPLPVEAQSGPDVLQGSKVAGTYGGNFPWTGRRYKIKVHGSPNPLQWISSVLNMFVDERIFHADGTLRRKNLNPHTVGRAQPCWRWDPLGGCMMIDFLWDDRRLAWRWDELRPDGEISSLVSKWHGIAHVGTSMYSFSMILVEEPQCLPQKKLSSRPLFQLSDSELDISMDVKCASVVEPVVSPAAAGGGTIRSIADRYCDSMDRNKAHIVQVLAVIDRMWLQELILQSSAEFLSHLIRAAEEVELSSNPDEMLSRTLKGYDIHVQIQDELRKVNALAFDSLKVRFEARGEVSLTGGLDGLRQTLAAQLDELDKEVQPLMDQLLEPMGAAEVRENAAKRLRNTLTELGDLSDLKEANSDTFLLLEEHLGDLQNVGSAFNHTVLQAARANPQNTHLQKTCHETLSRTPDACINRDNDDDNIDVWSVEEACCEELFVDDILRSQYDLDSKRCPHGAA